MTMRNLRRLTAAMVLAAAVAAGLLASAGLALADEPTGSTPVTMTFEQPEARGEEGGLTLSVRIVSADGEPVSRQPVEFFVTPDFLGERPVSIRTALTNADGVATATYTPTWEGEHRITARFAGDETYEPVEITSALQLTGVPSAEIPVEKHLSTLRQWATPGAIAAVLAVWLVLTVVVVRVGLGIWNAGRRSPAEVPATPEATAEGLPGGTFGR